MSDFVNTVDLLGDDAVCDGIINKTLPEYADNKITSVGGYVFWQCSSITKLDIPKVVDVGTFAFYGCSSMETANLPLVESLGNYAFHSCTALSSINIPLVTQIGKQTFRVCSSLASIDLPAVTSIDTYAFYNCPLLDTVILRSETVCELASTNAFGETLISSGTGYIYVPSALLEEYCNATNWSALADQIRAIEDYPDITGG